MIPTHPFTLHLVRHGFVACTLSFTTEGQREARYSKEFRAGIYRPIRCKGTECDWCRVQ